MRHREIAFFEGRFVPLAEANINVMTHAFNYGTAVFEGIRGYWNGDDEEMYLFRPGNTSYVSSRMLPCSK
ncbi:hypothetical protein [Chloracidobacterium aggregatum]|uniref:hypothetical protein n=1 Tax=Chloracidobacterium aggregatum TaxID=2851959 RepID=UPI003211A3D6